MAAIAPELKVPPYEPLCATVARAVGIPVAAVIADERSAAFDAAALVDVEYEPLDGVADPEAALADGAPLLYPEFGTNACYTLPLSRGDVDAAFAAAAHTTTLRIAFPRLAPAPLEPRGVLAQFDRPTGDLTVWATTQSPNRVRAIVSLALGLSDANVRVIATGDGRRVRLPRRRVPGVRHRRPGHRAGSGGRCAGLRRARKTSPRPPTAATR